MQKTLGLCVLLALLASGCAVPGRIAGILTNSDSNAWVKMGQCSGHPWGGIGAIVCPVMRKGSGVTNMMVVPNERRRQQQAINKTVTGGEFRMQAVIRLNPNDRADIKSFKETAARRVTISDYLVPTTLNGKTN